MRVANARLMPISDEIQAIYARWLSCVPWHTLAHLTFARPRHPEAALKLYRYYMCKVNDAIYGRHWYRNHRGVYYVVATESQELRRRVYGGPEILHFHALLGFSQSLTGQRAGLPYDYMHSLWQSLAGYAWLTPCVSTTGAISYITKYVTKGGQVDVGGNVDELSQYLPILTD